MRKSFIFKFTGILTLIALSTISSFAQTRLVLNGAKVNIRNGAVLVIANPATNAIIRNSGHIISEGENNQVKWLTGNLTGTYSIPFGQGNSNYLPLSFSKTTGVGNGYFQFATYGTSWQNSVALPSGVTNVSGPTADNSAMVIDRFWRIAAVDYTTKPELSGLSFTYLDSELASPNTISEEMLGAQRWNETSKSWGGFLPTGEVEIIQNKVAVSSVAANDLYNWWTLVDRSSPLPLELLSFEARKAGKKVNLNWVTAQEINCDNFEIQRSQDGKQFTTISTKNALGNQLNNYEFIDQAPLAGTSYYRLKQNDLDGTFTFTPIRSVLLDGDYQLSFYPNPITNHTFKLLLGDAPLGNYQINVTDLKGMQVYSLTQKIEHKAHLIELPKQLKAGIYLVKVTNQTFLTQFKIAIN